MLVDNTTQHAFYSFMDGFPGYNQIRMAIEDMEKTIFITTWGTFCYKVMPFGLKDAGATYQRAMVALLHDMMHKEVEVYMDDMIAKSRMPDQHVEDLRKLFERLRKYGLRLNPGKCTFGVKTGKLLGFIVNERGIEVDLDNVKAIQNMPPLELRPKEAPNPLLDSAGRINRLRSRATRHLRKERIGHILSQQEILDCEQRYLMLERTCCALVWMVKRLRQYMFAHTTWLIAKMDPLKYIFEKPALTRRIAHWQLTLSEYNIVYTSQKAIKRIALVEQLAHHPLDDYQLLLHKFPDEHIISIEEAISESEPTGWKLWFDGANLLGKGIGAVLASLEGQCFPFLARLGFDCTNNMAEYEACAMGITMAVDSAIRH
ncbi:Retrovirus-related Pol polyprotein from transposon 17.6, partial [Mucuna pruriens]